MRKLFLALFVFPVIALGAETKKTVHIEGMTCPSCAASVEREFKKFSQVEGIDIKIRKGIAIVSLKGGQTLSEKQIRDAVKASGYSVKSID